MTILYSILTLKWAKKQFCKFVYPDANTDLISAIFIGESEKNDFYKVFGRLFGGVKNRILQYFSSRNARIFMANLGEESKGNEAK